MILNRLLQLLLLITIDHYQTSSVLAILSTILVIVTNHVLYLLTRLQFVMLTMLPYQHQYLSTLQFTIQNYPFQKQSIAKQVNAFQQLVIYKVCLYLSFPVLIMRVSCQALCSSALTYSFRILLQLHLQSNGASLRLNAVNVLLMDAVRLAQIQHQ